MLNTEPVYWITAGYSGMVVLKRHRALLHRLPVDVDVHLIGQTHFRGPSPGLKRNLHNVITFDVHTIGLV